MCPSGMLRDPHYLADKNKAQDSLLVIRHGHIDEMGSYGVFQYFR